jgi:hypothetical protein
MMLKCPYIVLVVLFAVLEICHKSSILKVTDLFLIKE